ncbi:ETX/MTX2 family pore-forming toxin [Bacillus paramycoides]|uniref:ETX/MTX2 family pore-forming toxin n=1 Tax=Bacillus paramycoides TaxID=2026194 RepID=UPI00405A029C
MLKNNKKTKQILSLAMIGVIGTSFAFASPNSASAASTPQVNPIASGQENPYIENWDAPFKKMFNDLQNGKAENFSFKNLYKNYKNPTFSLTEVLNTSVEEDGSPITSPKTVFVGKSVFRNTTDRDQTFTTDQFAKTIEHSVSNSTTHGFNLGVKASAKFGLPLVGETNVEVSTEYNFSNTNQTTKTESYTYTASPQNIIVPAHSAVEVSVVLNTVKIDGKVNIVSAIKGFVDYEDGSKKTNNSLAGLKLDSFRLDNTINYNVGLTNSNAVILKGKGKYSAEYGTQFSVTVKPIVEQPRALAVQSDGTIADEDYTTTNEGYTYTAKPEVKKEQ